MAPLDIATPSLGYVALSPLLIVFVAACIGVLVEGVIKRGLRDEAQIIVTGVGLASALALTLAQWRQGVKRIDGVGSVALDGPTWVIWALLLVFALLTTGMFAERRLGKGSTAFVAMAAAVPNSPLEKEAEALRREHTEVFPLMLFALFGMMLFASANDLITMFVALEIFSLPLYLLCGLSRRRRLISQEAALKYFLLGSLSSAFFLYGSALLYGYSGSFTLAAIDQAVTVQTQSTNLLLAGLGLVTIGLLFKVGVVPFHSWTPDVYMGAPTPVTAFMAIATKTAAVGALLRVLYVGLGAERWTWQPLLAVLAVLTMLVGSVVALSQTDIKRLLAYSSIAHAGFLLVAITGASTLETGLRSGQAGSVPAVMFYLAAYGFATLGAFAIVTMVRGETGENPNIDAWAGIGRRHPVIGAAMTLFLLSFAGIPLTGGFVGKLVAFMAAWQGGYIWLVLVAVLMSAVAAYLYLKVIVVMFFREPAGGSDVAVARAGVGTWIVVVVGVVATLALGLFSTPVIDAAVRAGGFVR